MVLLHYLGNSRSGGSNPQLQNIFGIGLHTVEMFKYHSVNAIHSLQDQSIRWPDQKNKRKEIATYMFAKCNWVNCIGIANGTLFPLTYEPQSKDALHYNSCKFALTKREFNITLPGSQVVYITIVFGIIQNCFKIKMITLALTISYLETLHLKNSQCMVSSFKAPRGHPCVTSKCTIGILKAYFPFLQSIPMLITVLYCLGWTTPT